MAVQKNVIKGKLILTAVLFALTFAGVKPLAPLAVFGEIGRAHV